MAGLNKKLYYERAQHLTFLFQRQIRYEESIQNAIASYVQPGYLVMDVGANIGQYTLFFSEKVGRSGRVVAVEPDYKNFAFLQFNTTINRSQNVFLEPCGLGSAEGEVVLYRDTETGGRRSALYRELASRSFKGHTDRVPIKTLDSLIYTYGEPNFIKIDAEGAEVEILQGLNAPLLHSVFLIEVRAETKAAVLRYFKDRGYACYCIEQGSKDITREEEVPAFAHLLFVKTA